MASNIKERIYKFDNIKFLAIILVVVGHVVELYIDKSDMFKSLFIFIYSFHMPLFVFISGLFQKRFDDNNRFKISKIAFYVILGYLLKIFNALAKVISGKKFHINLFGGGTIEWFLFALSMFMITAYLTRKVHPAIMLGVTFVLGCISGYFEFLNDFLCLSRYFVFLPIYLTGYYLTPDTVQKVTNHYSIKLLSGLSMFVFFVICFRNVSYTYQLRRLMTGKNPFSTLPFECGFQHRLLCYVIAALMCTAVFCFIPNIRIPIISNMGKSTLAVYFWHKPILYLISGTNFFSFVLSLGDPLYKVIILTFAVLLGFVLSFSIFKKPLDALMKLIDKLSDVWCCVIIAMIFTAGILLTTFSIV